MSSGNTLAQFLAANNEPAGSNYSPRGTRNYRPVVTFDDTTQQQAIFTFIMPQHYTNGGITVKTRWSAVATTGTVGWDISLERFTGGQDADADGWATAQTITAATVDATSGVEKITSVNIAHGANMDSIVAGDTARIRIRRDVANDTAVGLAELYGADIVEQ